MDLGAVGAGGGLPLVTQPVAVAAVMARLADLAGREVSVVELLSRAGVREAAQLSPPDRAAALAVVSRLVEQGGGRLAPTPKGVLVELPGTGTLGVGSAPGAPAGPVAGSGGTGLAPVPPQASVPVGPHAGGVAPPPGVAQPGAPTAPGVTPPTGAAAPPQPLLVVPVVGAPTGGATVVPTAPAPAGQPPTVASGARPDLPVAHLEYRAVVERLALPADLGAALREVASRASASPVRFLAAVGPQPAASLVVVDAPVAALAEGLGPLIERLASERGVGLLQLAPPPAGPASGQTAAPPPALPPPELAATIREVAADAPTLLARGRAAPAILELARQQPDIAARLVLDLRAVLEGVAAGRGVDAAAAAVSPQVDTTLQALLAAATGAAGPPPPRRSSARRGLPMDAIRKAAAAFFQALFGVPVDEEVFRARAEVTVLGGATHGDVTGAIAAAFERGRGAAIASDEALLAELT